MIYANWKMNPTTLKGAEEIAYFSDYEGVTVIPPFPFLQTVRNTLKKAYVGAQNCYIKEQGAFTGEVSASMLKNIGCHCVLIGHSERRRIFNEQSSDVNSKVQTVVAEGMKAVVCVGEEDSGDSLGQIAEQLVDSLVSVNLNSVVVAYEPVFAIGTGKACPTDLARERRFFIEQLLKETFHWDKKINIIYGGSVDDNNALSYIKEAGFDGLLVGGASLKEDIFKSIVESVNL